MNAKAASINAHRRCSVVSRLCHPLPAIPAETANGASIMSTTASVHHQCQPVDATTMISDNPCAQHQLRVDSSVDPVRSGVPRRPADSKRSKRDRTAPGRRVEAQLRQSKPPRDQRITVPGQDVWKGKGPDGHHDRKRKIWRLRSPVPPDRQASSALIPFEIRRTPPSARGTKSNATA